ncbi:ABC transporter permease [Patescibacteria group bacterium]|nr:ABC transporter permease [Patescibacteria group bacterium]
MEQYYLVIKLALKGLLSNKIRAFLTMLGIIIGVGSVISIMSIGAGAESLITSSIKEIGTDVLSVLPGKSDEKGPPASAFGIVITTLTYDDAQEIAKVPGVRLVTSYVSGTGDLVAGSRSISGNFRGVTANYTEMENHNLEEGRFFTEQEERSTAKVAVLGYGIKKDLFPLSNPVGERVKINNVSFRIIGVLEEKGSSMVSNPDTQILVPLSTAQKVLLGIKHLNYVRLKAESEEQVEEVKARVQGLLTYRHDIKNPEDEDFSVRSLSQALETFEGVTAGLRFFLAAIAAISLIVGGIGITNIMLMTVKERTREIGLRKAIGAKPFHIKNQFIIEALVLTTSGGILGIIGGTAFSFLVALIVRWLDYNWEFSVPLSGILLSFFISMFIGVTFGIYPAKKAAALNPIDSLRYE